MNVAIRTGNEKKYYFNVSCISVENGREIFFRGKYEDNAVEIPLSNEYVEIEIKIKDKKKGED